jgi:uncharacterized ferritin-like protein (DUF455 family)
MPNRNWDHTSEHIQVPTHSNSWESDADSLTLAVHAGLWDSALETSHSLLSRLAIIHLVAEARGLDVNPMTIEKFRRNKDVESVKVLEVIHNDEITREYLHS